MGRALLLLVLLAHCAAVALARSKRATPPSAAPAPPGVDLYRPGAVAIIPQDNRTVFYEAFDSAKSEIRIEICVLEDPDILERLQAALLRGVTVRVIVDNGKYQSLTDEQQNLAAYLTAYGGQLHLSNPIFPRSFPKVILIDNHRILVGSACLDSTTFAQYRDYVYVSSSRGLIMDLSNLFENDWKYTGTNGTSFPPYNPTPPLKSKHLLVSPVNSADRYVAFVQGAKATLDVTTELLGDPTLQSELVAAVQRGVRVRLISPQLINGPAPGQQQLQNASLAMLAANGVQVRVTVDPQTAETPYMHARTAVRDARQLFLGSISYGLNSTTFNREVGLVLKGKEAVARVRDRFELDWATKSVPLALAG